MTATAGSSWTAAIFMTCCVSTCRRLQLTSPGLIERAFAAVRTWFNRGDLPLYRELGPQNGKGYEEVESALNGTKSSKVRVNERGEVIVSVALPVQRSLAVRGALMLSTQGPAIDNMVAAERLGNFKVFLVTLSVMLVLSFLLAGTIAGPVRRLAASAEMVRRRTGSRVEIPDFTVRRDEIGHLSGALRDMTDALYCRIEAIESFAADVAHELKNPLTSLRSAVETLPLARNENSRGRLLAVIEHDVKRLDRLISDISDASRLDAELQRRATGTVDIAKLLTTVVTIANEVRREDGVTVSLKIDGNPRSLMLPGHDSRLGQVVNNLIDNARSFSPAGGRVRVTCRRLKQEIEIVVDDDGPGVQPDAFEKIFQRFYTDRPDQGFGQNSGLGLSISKQIVEAHDGHMWVENRLGAACAGGEAPHGCGCPLHRAPAGDVTSRMAPEGTTVHASAVLAGARAVLIRGPTGAGKSRLALALIGAGRTGLLSFTRLVGDDRVRLEAVHGRLLVRSAPALAGLIEVRGLGIRKVDHEPSAVVGLVVDLAASSANRLPETEPETIILGIKLPLLSVPPGCDPMPAVLAQPLDERRRSLISGPNCCAALNPMRESVTITG